MPWPLPTLALLETLEDDHAADITREGEVSGALPSTARRSRHPGGQPAGPAAHLAPVQPVPETRFIEGSGTSFNTIPPNDFGYWETINGLVQQEPPGAGDPETLGLLASVGIVHGKPFTPGERMRKILQDAVVVGNATARTVSFAPRPEEGFAYYPGSAWFNMLFAGGYEFLDPPPQITADGAVAVPGDGARKLNARTAFFYPYTGITPAMCMRLPRARGPQRRGTQLDPDRPRQRLLRDPAALQPTPAVLRQDLAAQRNRTGLRTNRNTPRQLPAGPHTQRTPGHQRHSWITGPGAARPGCATRHSPSLGPGAPPGDQRNLMIAVASEKHDESPALAPFTGRAGCAARPRTEGRRPPGPRHRGRPPRARPET